jgi:hypothetical protein
MLLERENSLVGAASSAHFSRRDFCVSSMSANRFTRVRGVTPALSRRRAHVVDASRKRESARRHLNTQLTTLR